MARTLTTRKTVDQHPCYDATTPELYNWSAVINPKVREMAQAIAAAVSNWGPASCPSCLPPQEGLREALRIIARQAVWSVSVESEQPNGCDYLPGPGQ